jgi:hypothetical protein
VIWGSWPSSELRRVLAWAREHQGELALNWIRYQGQEHAGEDLAMPKVLDNVITAAAPDPATHTVALTWASGETTVNSFGHLVGKGVFAAFADPEFFAQMRVGEGGRSLEWPANSTSARMHCGSRRIPKRRPTNRSGRRAEKRSAFRRQIPLPVGVFRGTVTASHRNCVLRKRPEGTTSTRAQLPRRNQAKEAEGAALFRPTLADRPSGRR